MSMFGQPKPFASLSSTLLARKGQARPAMRPQGFGGFGSIPGTQDDLGWNDMGHPDDHVPEPVYAPPVAVPPVLRQREALHEEFEASREVEPRPAVPEAYEPEAYEPEFEPEAYQAEVEPEAYEPEVESEAHEADVEPYFEPEAAVEPAPVPVARVAVLAPVPVSLATAARIGRETQAKQGKAAFTLRLDHDRHLRLRLASALHNCSAQVLVTEALDSFLQSLPEVEELARQLPQQAKN
jgi:hypothetical protein